MGAHGNIVLVRARPRGATARRDREARSRATVAWIDEAEREPAPDTAAEE